MKCGIMSAMKDWKTYAIVALAVWCAWLTWKSAQRRPLDPEEVWDAYETAQRTPVPVPAPVPKKVGTPRPIGEGK